MDWVYYNVPYTRNNDAQACGASFDWERRLWRSCNASAIHKLDLVFPRYDPIPSSLAHLLSPDNSFLGEDRNFGGEELIPEMIPAETWSQNLRSLLPPHLWKDISRFAKFRTDGKCEICHAKGSDTHERWLFEGNVQKLMRIQYLCKDCHISIHIGFSAAHGFLERAIQHMCSIRRQTRAEIFELIAQSSEQLEARSRTNWHIDTNFLLPLRKNSPQCGEPYVC